MISYQKLKTIHEEIKNEHKIINKEIKKRTLEFKNKIKQDNPIFSSNYPNLLNRVLDKNYQKSLNKIVPAILKLHNDSTKKSKLLKNRLPNVYKDLTNKTFQTLPTLKKVKVIKEQYINHLTQCNEYVNKEQQKLIQKYEEKYPDFKSSNPTLLNGMLTNKLDTKTLEKMIEMYRLFYEKKLSNHDASVQFGTLLVDKFVKPLLKK